MGIAGRTQEYLLNLLFPRRCVVCGEVGSWACRECVAAADRQLLMELAVERSELGASPRLALFAFQPGLIRELLHNLKYNGIFEVRETLVEVTRKFCAPEVVRDMLAQSEKSRGLLLIPVPSSKGRLKERGYNQAQEIAAAFGRWLETPVWSGALQRSALAHTSLVGKGAEERRVQAASAFSWAGKEIPTEWLDKKWILIDDVCTTGSTISSCARILQPYSRFPVGALVVAREV